MCGPAETACGAGGGRASSVSDIVTLSTHVVKEGNRCTAVVV